MYLQYAPKERFLSYNLHVVQYSGDSNLILGSYGSLVLLQCVYNLGIAPLNLISRVSDFGKVHSSVVLVQIDQM